MRTRLTAPALAVLTAAVIAGLGAATAAAQTGRATGRTTGGGIGIADRIGSGIGGGISGRIGTGSSLGRGFGIDSHRRGSIRTRLFDRSFGRSIGVRNSPFGTIQHCAGVTVVTASSIWDRSVRDCRIRSRSKFAPVALLPVGFPVFLPGPYFYYDPYGAYYDAYAVETTTMSPPFITPARPRPAAPAKPAVRFDPSRPSTLVWPPGPFAVPVPVYTLGDGVIYIEHPPAAAAPVVVQPPPVAARPTSACARLTVILAGGDGYWRTVWLPALGATSVADLKAAIDARLGGGPVTIMDATGARIEVPARAEVSSVLVDACPPGTGGR